MVHYRCAGCRAALSSEEKLTGAVDNCPICSHPNRVPDPKVRRVIAIGFTAMSLCAVLAAVPAAVNYFNKAAPKASPGRSTPNVVGAAGPSPTPALPEPLIIVTAPEVDERLFLLRALDDLYSQIPAIDADPAALQRELARLRYAGTKLQFYIKTKKLDDSLGALYGDYVDTIDAYIQLLASIDRIKQESIARAQQDLADTGFDAASRGSSAGMDAYNEGYAGNQAVGIGLLTIAVTGAVDTYLKNQQLEQVKRQAVEASCQQFLNAYNGALARVDVTAGNLTTKYGWKRGEAGFDEEEQQEKGQLQRLAAAKDWQGISQMRADMASHRPRDPFIHGLRDEIFASVVEAESDSSQMSNIASLCLQNAALIPDGAIYDSYRLGFLMQAGDIANRAFAVEFTQGGMFSGQPNAKAAYAVRIWDACLKYTSDPSGEIREQRGWALAASGDLGGGLKEANAVRTLRGQTFRFAYNFAALTSRLGKLDESLDALQKATHAAEKFDPLALAKIDPDFAALRHARSADLTELDLRAGVGGSIDLVPGSYDNLWLSNNSSVGMTNINISVVVLQNGQQTEVTEKYLAALEPQKRFKFSECLWITGGHIDETSTITVRCDQLSHGPETKPIAIAP